MLLLLVLAALRAVSGLLGWLLSKLLSKTNAWILFAANLLGLALFAGYLGMHLPPGEPYDFDSLIFDLVVFSACFAIDRKWRPWR